MVHDGTRAETAYLVTNGGRSRDAVREHASARVRESHDEECREPAVPHGAVDDQRPPASIFDDW